eukprot:4773018-Amphidinium_carterae.1
MYHLCALYGVYSKSTVSALTAALQAGLKRLVLLTTHLGHCNVTDRSFYHVGSRFNISGRMRAWLIGPCIVSTTESVLDTAKSNVAVLKEHARSEANIVSTMLKLLKASFDFPLLESACSHGAFAAEKKSKG